MIGAALVALLYPHLPTPAKPLAAARPAEASEHVPVSSGSTR